jgi:uncharacterized protein with FMN-binding domain
MRRATTMAVSAAALLIPVGNAVAAARSTAVRAVKRKVVTVAKSVTGPSETAGRWGEVEVTLVVKKTTTTVGTKKTVARRITKVNAPVYPNHTSRSVFINSQALPLLVQEALRVQFDISSFRLVSGATDTSYGFGYSLQAALLKAKNV